MESLNEFFISYGYIGMCLAAFLAGTFVPFNSEIILSALIATTTLNPWLVVLSGTIGNVAGSVFNYYVGRIWDIDTICRRMHIKEKRLVTTKNYVEKKGAWIALFTFLPFLGSAIAIALGILRANVWKVTMYSFIGKLVRYILFALGTMGVVMMLKV
ncbi:MAG: DedA family protein [Bacteroidaceae bacterium]|jgi:membrane protein YqaA with SNARE-associated domain|nr:DedA family protein [Bacteroidaceae bacterium]